MTTVLRRREKSGLRHRGKTALRGYRQRLELCCHRPRNTWATKAGMGKAGSFPKALERAWLCRHLEFGLPISRTAFLLF